MGSSIFYWVFNMSMLGGAMGLLLLLLRRIRKIPAFAVYLLWTVPLIRLWIPFGIASPYSLMNLFSGTLVKAVAVPHLLIRLPKFWAMNSIQAAESYFPLVYKTKMLAQTFQIVFLVWAIVAAAALLAMVFLYILTKSELKDLRPYKDNIYFSDKISSPAVFGILPGKSKRTGLYRRRIILPADIRKGDIPYVLRHEKTHIRRGDNIWRIVALVTACVHWFNPVVWILVKYFFEDMELACDAAVLKQCGEEHKKEYAETILNFAAKKTVFASAFGGAKVKVRIQRILSYRKLTVFSSVCFAALVVAVMVILLTNGAV